MENNWLDAVINKNVGKIKEWVEEVGIGNNGAQNTGVTVRKTVEDLKEMIMKMKSKKEEDEEMIQVRVEDKARDGCRHKEEWIKYGCVGKKLLQRGREEKELEL